MTLNPPPNHTSSVQTLTTLLGTNLKITIKDHRTFIGEFVCLDPQGNLILEGANEFINQFERSVGMILIPIGHIVTAESM